MTIEEVLKRFPKEVELNNGYTVTLRPMRSSDLDELVRFFQQEVKDEDVIFLKDDVKDPETIRGWCENINYERVFPLVAIIDNSIVGNASLHMRNFGWAKFLGKIRITVAVRLRGLGLGTAMAKALEEVASELMMERLWAEVVEGAQEAGSRIFMKLGYEKAGTLKRIVKAPDGSLYDLGIYIKRIG